MCFRIIGIAPPTGPPPRHNLSVLIFLKSAATKLPLTPSFVQIIEQDKWRSSGL